MRVLRRGLLRCVRRLGPPLVLVSAVVVVGLGTHAALDWHHHGSPAAGFFHLHAHLGVHHHDHDGEHDEHGHHHAVHRHHPEQEDSQPGAPEPGSPSERQDDTFTIAFGVAPAPAVAAAEGPKIDPNGRPSPRFHTRIADEQADQPWIPRGPPV